MPLLQAGFRADGEGVELGRKARRTPRDRRNALLNQQHRCVRDRALIQLHRSGQWTVAELGNLFGVTDRRVQQLLVQYLL